MQINPIPVGYDIDSNILSNAKSDNIATLPSDNGQERLLRWFCNEDYLKKRPAGRNPMPAPELLIIMQREHLEAIKRSSLNVPKYISYLAIQCPQHPKTPAIMTQVEKLNTTNFPAPHELSKQPIYYSYSKKIGYALLKYYGWVQDTEQPYVLSDISSLSQYAVTSRGLTLIDIEPLFCETDATNDHTKEPAIEEMRAYANILAKGHYA